MTETQRTRILVALEMVQEVLRSFDLSIAERGMLGAGERSLRQVMVKSEPIRYYNELEQVGVTTSRPMHIGPMPQMVNITDRDRIAKEKAVDPLA